jgi:DNA-binding ferritin-like protein
MRRSRLAAPAALAAALALTGCGEGGGEGAYVERVDRAQREFAERVTQLSGDITATSTVAEDRRTLRRFEAALDEVVGDLRAIRPPGEVRPLHERLVRALAGYEREVAEAVRALDGSSPARVRDAQRELADAATDVDDEITRTTAAINDALRG